MKNFVMKGENLTVKAFEEVEAGQLVAVKNLIGVAICDAKEGENVTLATEGVFELSKGQEAIIQGEKAYFNADTKLVTNLEESDETENIAIGIFVNDSNGAKAEVKLFG